MKKLKNVFLSVALAGVALSQLSVAEANDGISGKLGTLGIGFEYVKPINNKFITRFGINSFNYDKTINESEVSYAVEAKLRNVFAIVDYHPWNNGFRLSGGAFLNGNKLSINAQDVNGTFEFNGVNYIIDDVASATGKLDFNSVSPYLGIGWGDTLEHNAQWSVSAELGAMYHGSPDVTLSVKCGSLLNAEQCTQLKNNVSAEKNELKNELSSFKWYPVLSIGVTYKF